MAVPKKKKTLFKRKLRYCSIKKKINFFFYRECNFCGFYTKNHKICCSCYKK